VLFSNAPLLKLTTNRDSPKGLEKAFRRKFSFMPIWFRGALKTAPYDNLNPSKTLTLCFFIRALSSSRISKEAGLYPSIR